MTSEPSNSEILAAIERLGVRLSSLETRFSSFDTRSSSLETRFSSLETRFSSLETRFSSLEKAAKDTNATVNRIDIRLKAVEDTVNEISVTTGVSSKAISTLRAELEALEARVARLENA